MQKNYSKFIVLLLVLSLLTLLAVGCGTKSSSNDQKATTQTDTQKSSEEAKTEKSIPEKSIKILAAAPGASWYTLATPLAKNIENRVPGLTAAVAPGGGETNLINVARGDAEFGFTATFISAQARDGKGGFDKPLDNVMHVASVFDSPLHVMARDGSGVTDFNQVTSNSFYVSWEGSSAIAVNDMLLAAYGLDRDAVEKAGGKIIYGSLQDGANMAKDKQIDIWAMTTGYPNSTIMDISLNPGFDFLKIPGDKLDKIVKDNPGMARAIIPKETYQGSGGKKIPAEDTETVTSMIHIFARADLSEELVYQFTAALWDNLPEYQKLLSGMKIIKDAALGNALPLHPGAKRYYEEKGLKF